MNATSALHQLPASTATKARALLQRCSSALAVAIVWALVGCAADRHYREANALFAAGQHDAGIAKLEAAVLEDPKNAEYRIALAARRAAQVNRAVAIGDNARRDGREQEAQAAYQRALVHDADNAMAKQGLEALATQRRVRQPVAEAEGLFIKGDAVSLRAALERLRPALAIQPPAREALALRQRIEEALFRLARPEARLAAALRKPVTLEFRDAPLRMVFDALTKVSGLNFVFDKDLRVDLKATISVKGTSIEDAVRLLLAANQLEQKVLNDNTILVYPNTAQKQKDYQTLTVRAFHLTNADVKVVSTTLKTLLKTKDLVVDERLGMIILRDTPQVIRMAERIVALQDLSDPEVMLDVEIMEIKRSRLQELGIQWPSQLTLTPLKVPDPTSPTSSLPITLNDLRNLNSSTIQATLGNLIINARKEDQDINILANPRIRVRNKDKARILIGDRVPVITTTSTSTGFISESVNYIDVGLKLEVEPAIYLDEEVAIKINLEVSSLVREVTTKSGSLSYQIGTRGANTTLRLRNGETQTLAGLISDEDRSTANKVPGIGELPVLSRLFGSHKGDVQSSEILLSITPRVVRPMSRHELFAAEFESGTENSIGGESLRLSTAPRGDEPAARPAATNVGQPPPVPRAAGAASAPGAAPTPADRGAWIAPERIGPGDTFDVGLQVNSRDTWQKLNLTLAFNPQELQLIGVRGGAALEGDAVPASLSHRVDVGSGQIHAVLSRQQATAPLPRPDAPLLVLSFKALKAGANAALRALSITFDPAPASAVQLPAELALRITP
jgi:general secretion pathway protein D